MLYLDLEDSDNMSNAPVLSTVIDNFLLLNKQFYEICSRLNEGQHHPSHFKFLSGITGIGKSFLINALTEYLKRVLRYPNQNLDQPSVFETASIRKAATGVNGIAFCILSPC